MNQEQMEVADNWTRAIGNFITSFAYVELLVYELFEILPQDSVSKSHSNLRDFSDRARLLQALIRSASWIDKQEIEDTLEELLPFATLRNNIAHNPLFIDVYIDGTNVVENARIVHAKKRTQMNHITLAELFLKQEALTELTSKLAFQVGFLGAKKRGA